MYCVREPHLHALFHALHLILLLQLGILNKLQLPLLGARAEVCSLRSQKTQIASAGVDVGLFSAHAHQNFCTLTSIPGL